MGVGEEEPIKKKKKKKKKNDPNPSIFCKIQSETNLGHKSRAPNCAKMNESEIYVQTTCTSSDHNLIICEVSNYWPKTAGGVALTIHPLTIRVLGKNC